MKKINVLVTAFLTFAFTVTSASTADIVSAASGYWTNAATWVGAAVPGAADNVTITNGHMITITGLDTYTVNSINIAADSSLTHHGNTNNTHLHMICLDVNNDCIVQGAINAAGLGYRFMYGGSGPGQPTNAYAGASHGGRGGITGAGEDCGNKTYGSLTAPTNLGSSVYVVQYPGGAVKLNVGGTLTLDGTISASASNTTSRGGPSGGSVYIRTGALAGNGSISANGGLTTHAGPHSGGGAGGRISVILTNSASFAGITMRAMGGSGSLQTLYRRGGAGTIYTETAAGFAELFLFNSSSNGHTTDMKSGDTWRFDRVSIYSNSILRVQDGATLQVPAGDVFQCESPTTATVRIENGGTLSAPADFAFDTVNILLEENAQLVGPTQMTIMPDGILSLGDGPVTATCDIVVNGVLSHGSSLFHLFGDITVNSNGNYRHHRNINASYVYRINAIVHGSVDIKGGGAINLKGFSREYPYGGGGALGSPSVQYGGAGHAGYGGNYLGYMGGIPYGSITAPTNLGSRTHTRNGGGAVQLDVRDVLTINGSINVDSVDTSADGIASPSAGSIFLRAGSIEGSGALTANAGVPNSTWGGGSGGRISLVLTNGNTFGNLVITAQGRGGVGSRRGAGGTIYLETASDGPGNGRLTIENGGVSSSVATVVSPNVSGTIVGDVILTNRAYFFIETNNSFVVNGSWSNAAVFGCDTGTTVFLAGPRAATVSGTNRFFNLVITNAGKTVSFTPGSSNAVAGNLILSRVILNSTQPGNAWHLDLQAGATQHVEKVRVRDSNASWGQTILANPLSIDEGDNLNWIFIPPAGTLIIAR